MNPHREIHMSEARARLPELVADIATTPVTLLHYGKPVADLVPHTTAQQRADAARARFREAVELANACGDLEILNALDELELSSADDVKTLIGRIERWKEEYGYALDIRDLVFMGDDLPKVHYGNAEVIFAYLHLECDVANDLHNAGADVIAWSDAIATVRRAAIQQNNDTSSLFEGYQVYEEGDQGGGAALVATGLTPQEFTRRALDLVAQRVAVKDVLSTFDEDAIPADILAMSPYASTNARDLLAAGLSMAEMCKVVRHYGPETRFHAIKTLARAGITDADTVIEMVDADVKMDLVRRATVDELTPEQWIPALPKVSKYSYSAKGLLSFSLMAEAAEEGVSLTAWDKLPEKKGVTRHTPYNQREWSLIDEPWRQVYPDRILELARMSITPGYLLACWQERRRFLADGEDFVSAVCDLRKRGLRLDVIQQIAAMPSDSSDQKAALHRLVELQATAAELSVVGANLGLGDAISVIQRWRGTMSETAEFLASLSEEQKETLTAAARIVLSMDGWERSAYGTKVSREGASLVHKAPEKLHRLHVMQVLDVAARSWGKEAVKALRDLHREWVQRAMAKETPLP